MDKSILVNATPLPGMPWEDRPAGGRHEVLWRHSSNPVISRDLTPTSNSIFNSAVVPFKGAYAGVFRCDDTSRRMNIHCGTSRDGVDWQIEEKPIDFVKTDPSLPDSEYKYDPRVVFVEDRYYIIWCNGYHGASIGMGYTFDFKEFFQLENPLMPYNRNGVLFPRKIGKNFALLSRPSDSGHTPFGDIFYSESPDLTYWGKQPEPLAEHQDRSRPRAHRDDRRMAPPVSRGAQQLQRIRIFLQRRPPRPRRTLEGHRPRATVPDLAAKNL